MGRERQGEVTRDTGRMGYRHEWEARDDRPLLVYVEPFWADETERLTYEAAVEADPIKDDDYRLAYAARISAAVVGKYKSLGLKMPRAHLTRRERDERLMKLRKQERQVMPIGRTRDISTVPGATAPRSSGTERGPDLPEWIEDRV